MNGNNGLIQKQKIISITVFVACAFFVLTFAIEKSKVILKMLPIARENVVVSKKSGFVITNTDDGFQIVVKKKDADANKRSDFHKIISSFYKKNNVVIEVGSNFGYNTVSLAANLKNSGKIYVFEPNTDTCNALNKTIGLNDIEEDVILKNIAISDHQGRCSVPNYHSMACNTLDNEMEIAKEKRPVDLITIDIPGMEMQILKSCKNIIKRSPNIIIAARLNISAEFSEQHKRILQELSESGINFYISTEKNKFSEITLEELLEDHGEVILIITRKKLNWLFQFFNSFK